MADVTDSMTIAQRLRSGDETCDVNACRVKDARSGCLCAIAADRIERLEAVSEWQEISTAPVGAIPQLILVFDPKHNPKISLRLADGNWWRKNPDIGPTHWLEISEPPQ